MDTVDHRRVLTRLDQLLEEQELLIRVHHADRGADLLVAEQPRPRDEQHAVARINYSEAQSPFGTTFEFRSLNGLQEPNQAARKIAARVQIVSRPPDQFLNLESGPHWLRRRVFGLTDHRRITDSPGSPSVGSKSS